MEREFQRQLGQVPNKLLGAVVTTDMKDFSRLMVVLKDANIKRTITNIAKNASEAKYQFYEIVRIQ